MTRRSTKIFGSRTYPVAYTYEAQGRLKTMTTWKNFDANSGAAVTTWNYNQYRGWLDNKQYADNHGPAYGYTPGGRLQTRTWARGVVTTYGYGAGGDLQSVSYSDSTPAVTNAYDRRGVKVGILQGDTYTTLSLNDAGELLSESYSGGPLNGFSVSNKRGRKGVGS